MENAPAADPFQEGCPTREILDRITELGRTLTAPLAALDRWARAHTGDVQGSRARYDQARASG